MNIRFSRCLFTLFCIVVKIPLSLSLSHALALTNISTPLACVLSGRLDIAPIYWHKCRHILSYIHDELSLVVALLVLHLSYGFRYVGEEFTTAVSLISISLSICEALQAQHTQVQTTHPFLAIVKSIESSLSLVVCACCAIGVWTM